MARQVDRMPHLGPAARKLQPKLRMVANGDTGVNALRAEHAAAVKVRPNVIKGMETCRGDTAVPAEEAPKKLKIPHLKKVSDDVLVNVFIEMTDAAEEDARTPARKRQRRNQAGAATASAGTIAGQPLRARKGNLAVATVPLDR